MQEQRNICSLSQLEAQKLFIERVFHHAIQMEKESKEDAKRDLEDYYGESSIERGNSTSSRRSVNADPNVAKDHAVTMTLLSMVSW